MKRIFTLLLIIITFSLAGCNFPGVVAPGPAGVMAPTAWLDAPLDGMFIPLAPYEVIFHIADEGGVAQGELSVNGQVLSSLQNPDGTETPATLRAMWTPPGPGVYTIQVRAQGTSGNWSGYASARVTVGEPTVTVSPTPVVTISPVITITPTFTPTPTPPPNMPITFTRELALYQFYYGSCQPNLMEVSVNLSNTASVKHVELYVNVVDNNSTETSGWNSYSVMSDMGNGYYQTTLKSSGIEGANKYASMTILYQFIVFGKDGKPLSRSSSYNDLTLTACASNRPGSIITVPAPLIVIPPLDLHLIPLGPTLIPPPK